MVLFFVSGDVCCVSVHVSWAHRIRPRPGPGPAGRGGKHFAVDFERKGEEMNESWFLGGFFPVQKEALGVLLLTTLHCRAYLT